MKLKKLILSNLLIWCVCAFYLEGNAQVHHTFFGGAANAGFANASVARGDVHSSLNNPAGAIQVNNWGFTASASYLYALPELGVLTGGFVKKLSSTSAISASIKHFGDRDLNQQIIGIAYSRKLFESWDIALEANATSIRAKGFGSKIKPNMNLSSIVHASSKVHVGIHIMNVIPYSFNDIDPIKSGIRLGMNYELSKKVNLMAEISKHIDEPFDLLAGFQYRIVPQLDLKAGISTMSRQFHVGFSFNFKKSAIHTASSWNNRIGFTPSFSYSLEK